MCELKPVIFYSIDLSLCIVKINVKLICTWKIAEEFHVKVGVLLVYIFSFRLSG